MAVTMAIMTLFVVVLWSCHNNTNLDNDDFGLMYDVGTSHPWSSYVSEDSSRVLKLEKVHSDEFGNSFRVLVFEPVYWRKGEFHFPELGKLNSSCKRNFLG